MFFRRSGFGLRAFTDDRWRHEVFTAEVSPPLPLEDPPPPSGALTPDLVLDWSSGSLPSEVTHGGGGNGTKWNSSGALVSASSGRITYDPVSLACLGLLIEEERTNYADHSQELDNSSRWWTSGITVTANDTAAPDGTATAEKFVGGDYDISHHIYNNDATTGSTGPVLSVFLKASTASCAFLSISNGWQTFAAALFDIDSTPATGATQAGSSSGTVVATGTKAYPSNWSRPWIAGTLSDGTGKPQFGAADNATTWNENSGYGDCKSSPFVDIYAWQAQIEVGTFPSSPIVHSGWTAVTRAADTATTTDATYLAAGSIKFTGRTAIASPASGTRQVIASAGTASNGWTVYRNPSNEIRLEVVVSSSVVADVLGATVANDTDFTAGIRLVANDCNIAVNGTAGTADTSCSLPSISTARFGYDASGANYLMATVAQAWAWTTPLDDDNLAVDLGDETSGGTGYTLDAAGGAYTVTGTAATLAVGRLLDAASGAYTVTGTAAGLTVGRKVTADAGAYAVTGTAAGLLTTRLIDAAAGSYSVTGTAAGLFAGRVLSADAGSYVVTGTDATLTVASDKTLVAGAGTYAVTGTDATLAVGRVLTADAGSYVITGTDATLTVAANKILAADAGAYTVTGTDAALLYTGVAPSPEVPFQGGGRHWNLSEFRKRGRRKRDDRYDDLVDRLETLIRGAVPAEPMPEPQVIRETVQAVQAMPEFTAIRREYRGLAVDRLLRRLAEIEAELIEDDEDALMLL